MKLAHYVKDGELRIGLVRNERVFDLNEQASRFGHADLREVRTIDDLLSSDLMESASLLDKELESDVSKNGSTWGTLSLSDAELRSPILNPEKILMIAINYASHSKEQNEKPPEEPYVFTKFRNALIGPRDPIIVPRISKEVDWEVELAVIIGKSGKNIPREDAMDYVAGYSVANDVSFRDMQFWKNLSSKSSLGWNWFRGKALDNALPLGPCLVSRDELRDPYSSRISLCVNGVVRQDSVIGEMLIKIDALIEYISGGVTLKPGDIICTGTPMGVAAFSGAPYLKKGDLVEARISEIGILRNPVIEECERERD